MKKYNANQNMVKWMEGIGNMELGKVIREENGEFRERLLTKEESESYLKGLKDISEPTGINLFDENNIIKVDKEINYDELLDEWADKVFAKADKCKEKRDYEESGSWKDGYLKGLNEAYIMAISMLTLEEKKAKIKLKENK